MKALLMDGWMSDEVWGEWKVKVIGWSGGTVMDVQVNCSW